MPATLTPVSLRLTPDEYFAWEETQEEKHDYVHGEVFSMSGATRTHTRLATNLVIQLGIRFQGTECEVFGEGMRIQVEPDGRYTYPDVSAVCGAQAFLDAKETTLTNPTLVVEVLSESTEAYDRGEKLDAYRTVASLREIVLVRQDRRAVQVYRRESATRWTLDEVSDDAVLALASVGAEVAMDDLYAGTGL